MRTVIVRGERPLPEALREVIERGSTSVQECRVPGPTPMLRDVDRIVFYAAGEDQHVIASARQAVGAEQREGTEKLVFVSDDASETIDGLAPAECFRWPGDEDRLKMAFMTSA